MTSLSDSEVQALATNMAESMTCPDVALDFDEASIEDITTTTAEPCDLSVAAAKPPASLKDGNFPFFEFVERVIEDESGTADFHPGNTATCILDTGDAGSPWW